MNYLRLPLNMLFFIIRIIGRTTPMTMWYKFYLLLSKLLVSHSYSNVVFALHKIAPFYYSPICNDIFPVYLYDIILSDCNHQFSPASHSLRRV